VLVDVSVDSDGDGDVALDEKGPVSETGATQFRRSGSEADV
jgi:hypothetical protein